jgi:cytochrome b561
VHWLLYALVLATAFTGWLFASFRGWSMSLFYLAPMPMLASDNAAAGKAIDGLHQAMEWTLLVVIGRGGGDGPSPGFPRPRHAADVACAATAIAV